MTDWAEHMEEAQKQLAENEFDGRKVRIIYSSCFGNSKIPYSHFHQIVGRTHITHVSNLLSFMKDDNAVALYNPSYVHTRH